MDDERGFILAPHHPGHAGQSRKLRGAHFRGAAHEPDAGFGRAPVQTPRRGPHVADRVGRDRAGVDNDNVRLARLAAFHKPGPAPGLAQGLAFILIDLAAQAGDMKRPALPGEIFW